ncbi:MAG: Ig-like domain-containing protein [Bryobacteraceae bacterium]
MMLRSLLAMVVCFGAAPVWGAGVKVLFDPSKPEIGPFPTDYLTAPSTTAKTGRKVRMPAPPDCAATPNACQEAWLLEQFDGFNVQARVRVKFSGAVNAQTLKDGIYLVTRENLTDEERGARATGAVVRLNQVVYDAKNFTAYGKPDQAMDQHRRYLLVVTDAVKDEAGDAVEADDAYRGCAGDGAADDYCKALNGAVKTVEGARIVGASVFTTMSATAWLETARNALENTSPTVSRPPGKNYFRVNSVVRATWQMQTRTSGALEPVDIPVPVLQNTVLGIGVGTYSSPNYLRPDRTASAVGEPVSVEQVPFIAYLPFVQKPEKGYPVVIYGHGLGDDLFGGPAVINFGMVSQGMAVVAIPVVGHGYGANGRVEVREVDGTVTDVAFPGRGMDQDGNGRIGNSEGCQAADSTPIGLRDCLRQTTVDLLQLVRVLKAGLDVDGDGVADFDPDQIYYAGQSLGAIYGPMFLALDPTVKRAVFNSGGGSVIEAARWSVTQRGPTIQNLALRKPALNNRGSDFDESYVLRNQPVKVVNDDTAIAIQNVLETLEWLQCEGDPLAYAVHLKTSPLKGVPEKQVLWQYAWGDMSVPNPAQSALVRHAGMIDSTWIFRNDLAKARSPALDRNPHTYLTNVSGVAFPITAAVQGQMASFLAGRAFDPNAPVQFFYGDIFEQPTELPEGLNFLEQ